MSGHCHDEHDHSHDHEHGEHDHSDDITPALQHSLYQYIDFDKIVTLNATNEADGRAVVKKTWAERLSEQPELNSDTDDQLLIHIPFTGQIKLHSVMVRGSASPSAPQTLKLFVNRSDLDFSTAAELEATQTVMLAQTSDVQDVPVKRALFGKAQSLTLFIEDSHGDDVTRLSYLGFKGEWMQLGRAPVGIVYESAANPSDHRIKGTSINQLGSRLG